VLAMGIFAGVLAFLAVVVVAAVTTDRLVQGLIAGAVYAVILLWFATASVTHFSINLLVVSGSASVGPNRAEVLGAGIVWGGLFCTLGALSSTDSSPGRHLLAAAGNAWDWMVGFYATVAATLAAGFVLWVVFIVWAGDGLARSNPLSVSGTPFTKTLPVLGLLLFGANAAALGLLRGMGVPVHWVGTSSDAGLVSLPDPAQVLCSVAVVAAMILAGWLTRARTTQRLTAFGFGTRVAVPFAVLSWLAAAAAPLEVTSGHHAFGLAVSLLPPWGSGSSRLSPAPSWAPSWPSPPPAPSTGCPCCVLSRDRHPRSSTSSSPSPMDAGCPGTGPSVS
jgi:hypothetical protein